MTYSNESVSKESGGRADSWHKKQELGPLLYLPDVPAYLPFPSAFWSRSCRTIHPPQASAAGWTHHPFAECRGAAHTSDFSCWSEVPWNRRTCAQEEFVPYIFLLPEGWMCKFIMSPLDSMLRRHTLWHRGILAVEKKKLQKHFTEPWNMPKHTRRQAQEPAEEKRFSVRGGWFPWRERGELRSEHPLPPCSAEQATSTQQRSAGEEQQALPSPGPTTQLSSCLVAQYQRQRSVRPSRPRPRRALLVPCRAEGQPAASV